MIVPSIERGIFIYYEKFEENEGYFICHLDSEFRLKENFLKNLSFKESNSIEIEK
jgi:hypothetical protein